VALTVTALVVAAAVVTHGLREGTGTLLVAIGSAMAMMACLMTLMGPVIVRSDLRQDLLHADVIKCWPLRGWVVVLGEVLAPTVTLAVLLWGMILVAAALWPGTGRMDLTLGDRLTYAPAAALVLPSLAAVGVVLQNALTLVLPSWVQLGRQETRGIEASGQRLITMLATLLVMILSAIPAGIVFGASYAASHWLLGGVAVPLAALTASVVLLGEAALGVWWAGKLFDRLDISLEHLAET
jgi:hypothetical protein